MTPGNLGIVFGPTLLRPRPTEATVSLSSLVDYPHQARVVETLIAHYGLVFDDGPEVRAVLGPRAAHSEQGGGLCEHRGGRAVGAATETGNPGEARFQRRGQQGVQKYLTSKGLTDGGLNSGGSRGCKGRVARLPSCPGAHERPAAQLAPLHLLTWLLLHKLCLLGLRVSRCCAPVPSAGACGCAGAADTLGATRQDPSLMGRGLLPRGTSSARVHRTQCHHTCSCRGADKF